MYPRCKQVQAGTGSGSVFRSHESTHMLWPEQYGGRLPSACKRTRLCEETRASACTPFVPLAQLLHGCRLLYIDMSIFHKSIIAGK